MKHNDGSTNKTKVVEERSSPTGRDGLSPPSGGQEYHPAGSQKICGGKHENCVADVKVSCEGATVNVLLE
jgi:hypothetical protein